MHDQLFSRRYLELATQAKSLQDDDVSWNLPLLLERLPHLKTLKASNSLYGLTGDYLCAKFSQPPLNHPLEQLLLPRDLMVPCHIAWIVYNCPNLCEMSIYDMKIDGRRHNLSFVDDANQQGINLGQRLEKLTLASLFAHGNRESVEDFAKMIKYFRHIKHLEFRVYGPKDRVSIVNSILELFVHISSQLRSIKVINLLNKRPQIAIPKHILKQTGLQLTIIS